MPRRSRVPEKPSDLTETEAALLRHCAAERADMVYLVDFTTACADLPKALRGSWFEPKLLSPRQKEAHAAVAKETRKALKRLFAAGLIDVGREDACPEGFKRRHAEILARLQNDGRWETGETSAIEGEVRHHEVWAEATDLPAVTRQIGGRPELVGLTSKGRELAERLSEWEAEQ